MRQEKEAELTSYILTTKLKDERKEIREWAKKHLAGNAYYYSELNLTITFTVRGIKEALNQPHKHYGAKNRAILNIVKLIESAEYVEKKLSTKVDNSLIFHYLSTEVAGECSFIVLKESQKEGIITFYSIVDKIKSD